MLTLSRHFGEHFGINREFDHWAWGKPTNGHHADFAPAVDIEEKEDHYLVSADLPGLSERDIDVRVEEGVLLLSGKREASKAEKKECVCHAERNFGTFHRSFAIGEGVDSEKIEAAYANGVLTVRLPKSEKVRPRQIPVKPS